MSSRRKSEQHFTDGLIGSNAKNMNAFLSIPNTLLGTSLDLTMLDLLRTHANQKATKQIISKDWQEILATAP